MNTRKRVCLVLPSVHTHTRIGTVCLSGTGLYELWKRGAYVNYTPDKLIDLVARILALVGCRYNTYNTCFVL